MIIVDSDILIEVTRGRNENILQLWTETAGSTIGILYSPVTEAELWAGARPSEHTRITMLFDALTCAGIDRAIGQRAGALLQRYSKSHGLHVADALIAATALHHSARLWTRNRKHYPIPELAFFTE